MLLAVEGGGFFSASASGYSKGLTLLLLDKKTEEKPMRVAPWNEYQLVDQESDPHLQLASHKNRLVRGCASFLCFGRTAAGLETPSPLKVGPTHQHQDVLKTTPDLQTVKAKDLNSDLVVVDDDDDDDDDNVNSINACSLKSSLKRPTTSVSGNKEDEGEPVDRNGLDHTERRVQWTDVTGGELFVIREFEPSEHSGSDDEYGNGNERSCSCRLM